LVRQNAASSVLDAEQSEVVLSRLKEGAKDKNAPRAIFTIQYCPPFTKKAILRGGFLVGKKPRDVEKI